MIRTVFVYKVTVPIPGSQRLTCSFYIDVVYCITIEGCNKRLLRVIVIIIIIIIQPLGQFGQEPEPSQATGIALVRCILGKFLGVVCHCFPPRLDVPTFATRCLHVRKRRERS